jgi:ABC-type antimicrobial peptide transport system permease subunit
VAANSRQDALRNDIRPVVYYTYTWDPHSLPLTFYELRTRSDPLAVADPFRRVVRELDPAVIVTATNTHTSEIDHSIYQEIAFARLSEAFAALALLIACVALYGTVSYGMARRTAEIGIRMALGASRSRVLRQSFRQVLGLGAWGLALGVPAALVSARYIESFLWGVVPYEPGIFAAAAIAVLAADALAGFLPARRAANIDPMVALRSE